MRLLWLWHVFSFVLRAVLWTLICLLALIGSIEYHLQLPLAHNIARDLTMHFVNAEIRGELRIGRIDDLELDHVVAHHAQLFDCEGRRIISADRVELVPDFLKLRHGLLRFRIGRITGGSVRLVDNGTGDPSLFTTFDSKHAGPGAEPLRVLIDQLIVEDMTVYGQVIQLRGVRAKHVSARGRLSIGKVVRVKIYDVHGTVVRPYDFEGQITRLRGSASTDPSQGTQLSIEGTRGAESVHVDVSYRKPAPDKPLTLDLVLLSDHLTPDTLRRVRYAFANPLAPPLRGRVELHGPPEDLALTAHVESDAGNAEVTGNINTQRGVTVHVTSDRIQLEKLVADAPSVIARGALHVSVGPEDDAKPQVRADIGALRFRGVLVPAFALDGVLEDNGFRIDKARATQGGQIAVRGRVGFDGHTDLHVDAHFPAMQRDPNLSRFVTDLEGELTTSLHVRTPARNEPARLDIEGKLELRDTEFGSLRAAHLVLNGKAHGDPALPRLDVEVKANEVQLLSYKLGNARFSMHGGPKTYTARGEFEAGGQKTFSFDAHVDADRKGFVVQAEPIEFSVGSESWRGAIHDLSVIHEREIELGLLRLASRAQRLEARGILRVDGEDELHAQLQNFDITAVRALLGESFPLTEGYADTNIELHGDVERPELSLTGAVRQATLGKLENVDALYTIGYRNGQLELDADVDLQERGTMQLLGQGELDATLNDPRDALRSGLYNLSLTAKQLDISLFPQWKGLVRGGKLQGNVEAQGGLNSITLDGNLTASQLSVLDWAPLELNSRFRYTHDELKAQFTVHDAKDILGRARGMWHVDWRALTERPSEYLAQELLAEDFEWKGQTVRRTLADLPFPVPGRSWPVQLSTRFQLKRSAGALTGDADATLTPPEQLVDASCKISADSKLDSHWQLANDTVTFKLDAALSGQSVAVSSGKLAWPFERFARGEASSERPVIELGGKLRLDQLEQVPGLCRHAHGQLSADLEVHGAGYDKPDVSLNLQARVVPQMLSASGNVTGPLQRCVREPLLLQAMLHGNASRLAIDANTQGCAGGPGYLQAQVPWTWGAAVPIPQIDRTRETTVQLDFQDTELEPALNYLPGVRDFSGRASGQLSLRERAGVLDARGQLALSGGRLYAVPTGQELRNVALVMEANGNWLKLDSVSARVGRGSLELAGGVSLAGWKPERVQLGLVLRDLPIQREGIDLASLSGSAAIVGEIGATESRTAVKLHSLAVSLPASSSRSLQSLEPHTDITLTTDVAKPKADKPYNFEFAIDGRNQISARRNDFEAALATELDVAYRDPDLHVGGYIEFRRGTFELFGKRFEVNRGSMRFDGSTELNPEVSMVATYEPNNATGGSTVMVNVSGTLADPVVNFYSERCPGDGAVVLLVSGRCPTEEGGITSSSGVTSSNAAQGAFTAGMLGGILTLGAQRQLGGLVPRLAVESSALGTRTRVKAGFEAVPPFMRSLVERVYVQGAISTPDQTPSSTNTGSSATPDFLLELYFPNNIVGSGRVAPTTRSWGIDATWEP